MTIINTHYLPPTNTRGARIKAAKSGGKPSVTLPWDYALSAEGNHDAAFRALATDLLWVGKWTSGATYEGGRIYVRGYGDNTITVSEGEKGDS